MKAIVFNEKFDLIVIVIISESCKQDFKTFFIFYI